VSKKQPEKKPKEKTLFEWFKSLFYGNTDFYTIHQPPFSETKDGKYKAVWCGFAEYGTKSFPKIPNGAEKGDFVRVTDETYRNHLNGKAGLGLVPVFATATKKNLCTYGVIDIDARGVDYVWLIRKLCGLGFKFVPFRSKSGGLHLYFFFERAEPAGNVIAALQRLTEVLALDKLYAGQIEIFPKQSTVIAGDKNANGLLLPFFNGGDPEECPNRMYGPDGKLMGIRNAREIVDGLFTTLPALEKTLDELPYQDAPYCIQALLLTGALFKEGDHRNDFIFTVALYLKLREKTNFLDHLKEMNARLECPLPDGEVEDIYESAITKDFQIRGQCKKLPCSEYCNQPACRKREHGVGKAKGNTSSDIEFGKVVRVLTKNPYYLIEVRVAGTETYAQIRVDDTAELMNQRVIQRECIRSLKYAPAVMSQSAWIERLNNDVLNKIEDQAVAETTDMTEESRLYKYFMRFLTHSQAQKNAPYMINMGYVYREDGVYYFDGDGFKEYLDTVNFRFSDINIRAELESFGCKNGSITYKTVKGLDRRIDCWKKEEDDALRDMQVFYEEVYDEDNKNIEDVKAVNEREGEDVTDNRF
jgi:hypothetical protein